VVQQNEVEVDIPAAAHGLALDQASFHGLSFAHAMAVEGH